MKSVCIPLLITSFSSFAGQVAVDLDPVLRGDWLVYDDGSPSWLTWDGTYRGVWFNLQDFWPWYTSGLVLEAELWFYHHSSYPWDTSDVYIELWNGDAMGPAEQLDQTMAIAYNYVPIYVDYGFGIQAEDNFWCIANTELSAACWPSILSDGAQGTIVHSFYSDDFTVWEPWGIGGACNYFISVFWQWDAFESTTWGAIKTAF